MKVQRNLFIAAAVVLVLGGAVSSGAFGFSWSKLGTLLHLKLPQFSQQSLPQTKENVRVVTEESVVIDAVDKVSPSVVTVGITGTRQSGGAIELNPFDPFSPFRRSPGKTQKIEADIGSGFIVGSDGLIVTNKHVVSDTQVKYRVITNDDKTYDVVKIYRDPANDLAIVKIDATNLPMVDLGDSSKIKVGQLAIAIGTALGQFRHTVTTGVISGVGRGITAGSPFEGDAEQLDNVIQTDAAINPGNSGGPLLNSAGQVIGVNTAVSQEGQNIGFALPINVVKEAIDIFNKTGQFNRPFLGVRYRVIEKNTALMNDVPEGAYIIEVVKDSPADKAGLAAEDIITKIDTTRLVGDSAELSKIVSTKKVGDVLSLTIWRDGKEMTINVTLGTQE